jgi:hypothetical protein
VESAALLDAMRQRIVQWKQACDALTHHVIRGPGRSLFMSDKPKQRRVRVRGVRRVPPDIKKLSRALIALALAQAQAEADAQAEHEAEKDAEGKPRAA